MGDDDRIIGEILQLCKDTKEDVTKLIVKVDDININGTVVCRQNAEELHKQELRLKAIEKAQTKALVIISAVIGSGLGLNQVLKAIF